MEKEIRIAPTWQKSLVIGNTTFRSCYNFALSETDYEKARMELNETDDVRNASLGKLKELLLKDKDVRYRTDDTFLLRYLRYRKFKSKEAYNIIRTFYKTRKEYPELFSLSSNLESHLKANILNILPYTDEEGSVIFLNKFGNWKIDELSSCDLLQLLQVISDIITMNPNVQIHGFIAIWDFKDITASHLSLALHPSNLRLWIKMLQELYPWRIKRVILFNCNAVMHTVFAGIRYLLKKKNADKVTILHSDLSKLHEYINPVLLPKEYGGSLKDNECSMSQPILDNLGYLKYERSFADL